MTKSSNCAIMFQYNSLCLNALSPMRFQFAYPFKIEAFFLVPQVLINSNYDTLSASKFLPRKLVSDLETDRNIKGLNLEDTGDEEGPWSYI